MVCEVNQSGIRVTSVTGEPIYMTRGHHTNQHCPRCLQGTLTCAHRELMAAKLVASKL